MCSMTVWVRYWIYYMLFPACFPFSFSYSIPKRYPHLPFIVHCSCFVLYLFIYEINGFVASKIHYRLVAVLSVFRSICLASVQCPVSRYRLSNAVLYKHEVSNNLLLNHFWLKKWMNKTGKNVGNKELIDIFLKIWKRKKKSGIKLMRRFYIVCPSSIIVPLSVRCVHCSPIQNLSQFLVFSKKMLIPSKKPLNEISGLLCWQLQIAKCQMDPLFNLNIIVISVLNILFCSWHWNDRKKEYRTITAM